MRVRSLTRPNREGVTYRRLPEVERQIGEALALSAAALSDRAGIADYAAPDYLKDECLVYLVREFHREGRDRLVDALAEALVPRCRKATRRWLRSLTEDEQEDAFADIVVGVFGQILDLDSDVGDFLQVRFALALKARAIRAFKGRIDERKRADDTVSLASLTETEVDDEDGRRARPATEPQEPTPSAEDLVLYREGLDQLRGKQQAAFVLRYYHGWPTDPPADGGPSLTAHFGTTSRTIRYWLAQAERTLREWRDGGKEH